jgi:glycosyltransferase involved in cell wall biosynthesis
MWVFPVLESTGGFETFNETKIQPSLSVVIPVYNQESQVLACLDRVKSVVEQISESFELVVVNDGSVDGTLRALEKRRDDSIRLISYNRNRGKGYAVKKGVLESRGDMVMFIDGDLDISPHLIGQYFKELKNYDLVIASKRHPLSKVSEPASRRFLSRSFNLLAKILTGVRVSDTQAGMKAGNGKVLKKIFEVMVVKRYAFDVEMLAIASLMGASIKEMQVDISLDKRFKVGEMWKMFRDVLAIGYRLRMKRWYQQRISMLHEKSEKRPDTLKHGGPVVDVSA